MTEIHNPGNELQGRFFQSARMVDVGLLGPFMIWYGWKADRMPDWARVVMVVSGLMTMGFNWRNWLLVEEAKRLGVGCEALYRLT